MTIVSWWDWTVERLPGFSSLSWCPAHCACRLEWLVWCREVVNCPFYLFLVTMSLYLFSQYIFHVLVTSTKFFVENETTIGFWNNVFDVLSQNIGVKRYLQKKVVQNPCLSFKISVLRLIALIIFYKHLSWVRICAKHFVLSLKMYFLGLLSFYFGTPPPIAKKLRLRLG